MFSSLLVGALIMGGGPAAAWPVAAVGRPKVIEGMKVPSGTNGAAGSPARVIQGGQPGMNRSHIPKPRVIESRFKPRDINHAYNPEAVVTVEGPLLGIKRFPFEQDQDYVYLTMNLLGEIPNVILGPQQLFDDAGLTLELTEPIQVTGAITRWRGRFSILANEITAGGTTVVFRNETGKPTWAGAPPFHEDETPKVRPWNLRVEPFYILGRSRTVSGPIVGVQYLPLDDDKTAVMIEMHVQGENPQVFLGTRDFLEKNNIVLDIGKRIQVSGQLAVRLSVPLIIADTLLIDGRQIDLPDDYRQPPPAQPQPAPQPPPPAAGEGAAD